MIFPDTISISRNQKTGVTALNEPEFSLNVINLSQKCNIQSRKGNLIVAGAGSTNIMFKVMFCPIIDIQQNDVVTDLTTNITYKVTNVNSYSLLSHYEVEIESGVI